MEYVEQFKEVMSFAHAFFTNNIIYWCLVNAFIATCISSCIGLIVFRYPKMVEWKTEQDINEIMESKGKEKPFAPREKPDGLSFPGSRCDHCHTPLKFWHNIPILGWLMLRGKCGFCKGKIPVSSLMIEVAGALLGAGLAYYMGVTPWVFIWIGFFSILIPAIWIDWNTCWLLDEFTDKLIWGGLILSALAGGESKYIPPFMVSFLGLIVGYMVLYMTNAFSKLVFKKEGIGEGDFKLLGAMGVWFGTCWVLHGLLLAIVFGVLFNGIHAYRINRMSEKELNNFAQKEGFPFGPSLAFGVLAAFLIYYFNIIPDNATFTWPVGKDIINYYH